MEKYEKYRFPLCVFFGVVAAIITCTICLLVDFKTYAILLSLIAWLIVTYSIYIALNIEIRIMNRRYAEIENAINVPVFHKTMGNYSDMVNKHMRYGNIYFSGNGILFVNVEKKNYEIFEIARDEITEIEFDIVEMKIHTSDNVFKVSVIDAEDIERILKERGWII